VNIRETQLHAMTNAALIGLLEGPEGAFGATSTELLFVGEDANQRIRLVDIRRVARSGGFVIVSGEQGEMVRVKLNVSNERLLPFFRQLKEVAAVAKLEQAPSQTVPHDDSPMLVDEPATPGLGVSPPARHTLRVLQRLTTRVETPVGPVPVQQEVPSRPVLSGLMPGHTRPFSSPDKPSIQNSVPKPPSEPAPPRDAGASSTFWPDPLDQLSNEGSFDHLRVMGDHAVPKSLPPLPTRLAAAGLDAALFLAVQTVLSSLMGIYPGTVVDLFTMGTSHWTGDPLLLMYDVFAVTAYTLVLSWPYFALMESAKWQGTLGKLVLRLYVTDLDGRTTDFGRATWRHMARLVPLMAGFAVLSLGVGLSWLVVPDRGSVLALVLSVVSVLLALAVLVRAYLRIRFDSNGQTLYDSLGGCLVQYHEADLPQPDADAQHHSALSDTKHRAGRAGLLRRKR
jgi:uncharacterized RDD family membrane protein YckC